MPLQDGPRVLDGGDRALQVGEADRPFAVGEQLPAVCTARDVARLLRMTESGVHQLRAAGKLARFVITPRGQKPVRYSGRLLQQWANGELPLDRVFGAPRARRAG